MFRIAKKFSFSASHQLFGLPEGHKCGRLHGHNYTVEVVLRSETLNQVGFVRDYGDLGVLKKFLDEVLDHQHLNSVLVGTVGAPTTAECLARYLWALCKWWWPETEEVRVSETENTWASYREG